MSEGRLFFGLDFETCEVFLIVNTADVFKSFSNYTYLLKALPIWSIMLGVLNFIVDDPNFCIESD